MKKSWAERRKKTAVKTMVTLIIGERGRLSEELADIPY
jgi:hypothetical protein